MDSCHLQADSPGVFGASFDELQAAGDEEGSREDIRWGQPLLPTSFLLQDPLLAPVAQPGGSGTIEYQLCISTPTPPPWLPRAHSFHLRPFLINFPTKCVP